MSGFVTVSARDGALRGRRRQTPAGKAFLSFQGVPYAKPPLGSLRFKAPEPPESWTGIRDATKEGNQSVQYDTLVKQVVGDEDCLFLNVLTPRLPKGREENALFPVLVWIHGGGFMMGSSNMYDAEPFMDYGVVVVTINYRVGPLGFLSLGNVDAPGNAGLKDQTMALRWVKENIAAFGGDPGNVTIFGESAGGASIHYQVVSPLSKGLFRRAIAQSGTALCSWAISRDPLGRAKRLALAAGCDASSAEDPQALLKWLREVPALKLLAALDAAKTPDELRGLIFTFVPCVEPEHPGAFLPDDPAALVAVGAVNRVPLMLGCTSHEGMLLLPGTLLRFGLVGIPEEVRNAKSDAAAAAAMEAAEAKLLEDIASDLERLLPKDLLVGRRDMQRSRQLVERVKQFFFDGNQLSEDTLEGYVHINSDVYFGIGMIRAARHHARLGIPVYLYEFDFRGRNNFVKIMLGDNCKVQGTAHGDELGYQFNMSMLPKIEEGSPEELVRRRIIRLWTDFAKGGNPTPLVDDVITTPWLPYSESAPNYFHISEELKSGTNLLKERVQFWEELYKK